MTAGELLAGAIDLHRHGYPELVADLRPPLTDIEDLRRCEEAGFAGTVLKSHMWPTMGRVHHLQTHFERLKVVSSITLNQIAGGFSALAVESAGRQGARVLYMPTWSARNDLARGGFSKHMRDYLRHAWPADAPGLTVLDAGGAIRSEVREVLAVAAQFEMVVFTGHLSVEESIAIADSGLAAERLVFAHPDSHSIGATREQIATMAQLGSCIELCALGLDPHIARITPEELAEIADLVSPERCVLTSDYFFPWTRPSSEALTDLAEALLGAGVAGAAITQMACRTPARLLGWTDDDEAQGK